MNERVFTIEESQELFERELEGMLAAAEGDPRDSAYWWSRITGNMAKAKDDVVVAEITPEQVELLLRDFFENDFDTDDLDQVAKCLRLLCPSQVEVLCGDDGDWTGLRVTDEELPHESLDDCE